MAKRLVHYSLAAAALGIFGVLSTTTAFAIQPTIRACRAPADITRLDYVLARTARRLADGEALKIVAIGSSSTAGAGASSPSASYPSRLEVELKERFPHNQITVINRGVNGEEAKDMVARFDENVIAEKPDLVLWQLGSNSVLRGNPLEPSSGIVHDGVARLKAAGADVVLINPQFAPKILAKNNIDGMVKLIDTAAKEGHVGLFRRFAVMRHWREEQNMTFDTFLSPDELHMNDWSYSCLAKLLGSAITEAATRPSAAAQAMPAR